MGTAQSAEIEGRVLKVKRKIADGTHSQLLQVKQTGSKAAGGGTAAAATAGGAGAANDEFAVKRLFINSSDNNAIENAKWEIKIHKSVPRSPYVVAYEGAKIMSNPSGSSIEVLILMEYCGGGTLADMLRDRHPMHAPAGGHAATPHASGAHGPAAGTAAAGAGHGHGHAPQPPLTIEDILRTFSHVTAGVAACHTAKPPVIHRDIRPDNIWLHESGAWKLGDFGSATMEVVVCRSQEDRIRMEAIVERCTQAAYRAPEMVDLYSGTPLSTALDIWALGCLFYMLLFNRQPFPTGKLAILSRKYTVVEHNYPPAVIAFLEHMLTVDAAKRPTILQVQQELKALITALKGKSGGGAASGSRPSSASLSGFADLDWHLKPDDKKSDAKTTPVGSPHNAPSSTHASVSTAVSSSLFDANLQKSLQKATAHDMVPPKAKHVRALVQASWMPIPTPPTPPHTPAATDATRPNAACKVCRQVRAGLPGVLSYLDKRLQLRHDIIVFKSLATLHRLIASGPPELTQQIQFQELGALTRVKKAWTSFASASSSSSGGSGTAADAEFAKSPVADLISSYADYLERRIAFSHKYTRFEGNFAWCQWLSPMLQDKDNQNALAAASLASSSASSTGLLSGDPSDVASVAAATAAGASGSAAAGGSPSWLVHNHVHSSVTNGFEFFARTVKDDSAITAMLALCAHAIGVGEVLLVHNKPGLSKEGKDFRETILPALMEDINAMHRSATFELTQLCLATGIGADFLLDASGTLLDAAHTSPPPTPPGGAIGSSGTLTAADAAGAAAAAAHGGSVAGSTKNRSLDEEGAMCVILRSLLVQYRATCQRLDKLLGVAKYSAALLLATSERPLHIVPISLPDLFTAVSSTTAATRLPVPSHVPSLKAHNTVLCARFQEQMVMAGAARVKTRQARGRSRTGSSSTDKTQPRVHAHAQIHVTPPFSATKLTKAHSEAGAGSGSADDVGLGSSPSGSRNALIDKGRLGGHVRAGSSSSSGGGVGSSSSGGGGAPGLIGEKSKSLDKKTVVKLRQNMSKSLEKRIGGGGGSSSGSTSPAHILIPPPDSADAAARARRQKAGGGNSPHPAATPSPPLGPSQPFPGATGGVRPASGATKGWAVDWDDDTASSVSPHTTAPALLPVIYAPTPAQAPFQNPLPVILSNDALYDNNQTTQHATPQLAGHPVPEPATRPGETDPNAPLAGAGGGGDAGLDAHSPSGPAPTGHMAGILGSFDPLTPQHRSLQAPSPTVAAAGTPTSGGTLPRQGSSERLPTLPPSAATSVQPAGGHATRVTNRPANMRIKVSDGSVGDGPVSASAPTVGTPHSPKTPHSATDRRTPSPSSPAPIQHSESEGGGGGGGGGQPVLGRAVSIEEQERRKRSATSGVPAGAGAGGRPDDVFAIFDPIQQHLRRNTAPVHPTITVAGAGTAQGPVTTHQQPSPTHSSGSTSSSDVASAPAAAANNTLGLPPRRDSHDLSQSAGSAASATQQQGVDPALPKSPKRVSPPAGGAAGAGAGPTGQGPVAAPGTLVRGGGDGIVVDQFAALEYRNQMLQIQDRERRAAAAAAAQGLSPAAPSQPPLQPLNGAAGAAFYTPFGAAPQQYYSVQKAPQGYVPASAMGSTHMNAGVGLQNLGGAGAVGTPGLNTNQQALVQADASGAAAGTGGGLFADFNPLKATGIAVAATSTAGNHHGTRNPRAGKIGRTSGSGGAAVAAAAAATHNPGAAQALARANGPPTQLPLTRPGSAQQTMTHVLTAEQTALAAAVTNAGGIPSYPPPKYQTNTPAAPTNNQTTPMRGGAVAPNTAINNSPNHAAQMAAQAQAAAAAQAQAQAGTVRGGAPSAAPATATGKKVDHFTQFDPFQDPAFANRTPAAAGQSTRPAAGAAGAGQPSPAQLYQQQQAQAAANQRAGLTAAAAKPPQQPHQPLATIKSVINTPAVAATPAATPAPAVVQSVVKNQTAAAGGLQDVKRPAGPPTVQQQPTGGATAAVAPPPQQPPPPQVPAPAPAASQSLIAMGDEDTGEIDFTELTLGKRIGMGAFAEVFTGVWRGTDVAVKKLIIHPNSGQDVITEFKAEVKMLRKLRHPHIVLFMAASTKLPNLCVVTELLQGSLFDLLHNSNIKLSWKLRLQIALDTARGMTFLHLGGIIHRDLKSPNLLLDAKYRVKVADFGLARTKAVNTMTGQCGTFQWMAPEVIESTHYTEKADVFSFAIILWELVARQVPYSGMNAVQVSVAVMTKDVRPPIPDKCPPAYAQLIRDCWDKDPNKRPAFPVVVDCLQAFIKQASNPE